MIMAQWRNCATSGGELAQRLALAVSRST